jgi:hypothetical protein
VNAGETDLLEVARAAIRRRVFRNPEVRPEKGATFIDCNRMPADLNVGVVSRKRQLQPIFVPATCRGKKNNCCRAVLIFDPETRLIFCNKSSAPRMPGGLFLLRAPCPQKIKPASKKNPYRLQGRSRATSYLQGSTRARPLSAFIDCRCLNERPRYENRSYLPRYRHHRVGICIVVLELAPNQTAGKFADRGP